MYSTICQMHRSGIYHGDLAPHNVTMNDEGHLMVLDFGLSNSHDCPGGSQCEELVDLKFALHLDKSELWKTIGRAGTVHGPSQSFYHKKGIQNPSVIPITLT